VELKQARAARLSVNAAGTAKGILSMKLGFICLNVPGHLNPMTALARQLQARGHDVVFLYSSGAAGILAGPKILQLITAYKRMVLRNE